MPVCKYYLQGICRYGSNCKFEHPTAQNSSQYLAPSRYQPQLQSQANYALNNNNNNRFKYVSQQQQQHSSQMVGDNQKLTDAEFINLIQKDLSEMFNAPNAWKLSCYGYRKGVPSLPILEDLSPEEVRYYFYEAKKHNNLKEVYDQFKAKQNEIIDKIKQLVNPNQQVLQYLMTYFHESEAKIESSLKSQFVQQQQQQQPASTNPFMRIVQQQQQSQQANPFAMIASGDSGAATAAFGGLFSSFKPQPQPQPQQPIMVQTEPSGVGLQYPPSGMFAYLGAQQSQPSNFGFMNTNNAAMNTNNTIQPSQPNGSTLFYSRLDELNKDELDEFMADEFTMGRIPVRPPPREFY